MTREKEITGFRCAGCGGNATEGSMKHPYCKKCFKEVWDDDYEKYNKFMEYEHL